MSQIELVFAAFLLIALLINALQSFFVYKSIPPGIAEKIFAGGKFLTSLTPDPKDDKLVSELENSFNRIEAISEETNPDKPRD